MVHYFRICSWIGAGSAGRGLSSRSSRVHANRDRQLHYQYLYDRAICQCSRRPKFGLLWKPDRPIAGWGNCSGIGGHVRPRLDRNIFSIRPEWFGMGLCSLCTLKGAPPIVEPPPTFTPITVSTIDPAMIATFSLKPTGTRLPTFTPPAPLVIPTFSDSPVEAPTHFPLGIAIIGLGVVGILGFVISFVSRR